MRRGFSYYGESLPPVHIDRARMGVALGGPRHQMPADARTPSEIASFLDSPTKEWGINIFDGAQPSDPIDKH